MWIIRYSSSKRIGQNACVPGDLSKVWWRSCCKTCHRAVFTVLYCVSLDPVLTQGIEALKQCSIPVLSLALLAAFLLMLDIGLGVHCELISLLAASNTVWLLPSQILLLSLLLLWSFASHILCQFFFFRYSFYYNFDHFWKFLNSTWTLPSFFFNKFW